MARGIDQMQPCTRNPSALPKSRKAVFLFPTPMGLLVPFLMKVVMGIVV